MNDARALGDALEQSLGGLEPAPFHERVLGRLGETPLTPGVLTIRTARAIDDGADTAAAASRGAGVQLCYEGLELTRSVLRDQAWDGDRDSYHRDLLVAEVLVSQGFANLAQTGVVTDATAIVQRFGRTQTDLAELGDRHGEDPLERDVLELAVNAGVDLVLGEVPPSARARSADIAEQLLSYPLPDPGELGAVEDQLGALAGDARPARTDGCD